MSSFLAAAEQPDYDYADISYRVLSDTTHTARKWHTCDSCDGIIQAGTLYGKRVALDEGEFTVFKYHADRTKCRSTFVPFQTRELTEEEIPF